MKALISLSDKTGIEELAGVLLKRGYEILSTGGTAKILKEKGFSVTDVALYTGSPEILDGRVKTLHPKIHGGLLARRDDSKHLREMDEQKISAIDILVVNFYPFEKVTAKSDCLFEDAVENIDIGGPAMVRSAAKNHGFVAVITDPNDYPSIIKELNETGGRISSNTRLNLAKKAFAAVAKYDCAIANYLGASQTLGMTFERVSSLRYGENPHQKAAFYKSDLADERGLGIADAKIVQGKELSYNNIADADAAVNLVREFSSSPFAVAIIKHLSTCGVAVSRNSLSEAYSGAFSCDPLSAFGGVVAINSAVDENLAKLLAETFYEVIIAEKYDVKALEIFSKKKNLRILKLSSIRRGMTEGIEYKKVTGGILVQDKDTSTEDLSLSKVVTKRKPVKEELADMDFVWKVCKHARSNAIVIASGGKTLGIGQGQTSRVDSAKIAVSKMNENMDTRVSDCFRGPKTSVLSSSRSRAVILEGVVEDLNLDPRQSLPSNDSIEGHSGMTTSTIVAASDAFFPFRDGVDILAKAGIQAIAQPGGSMRDEDAIKAADEHNVAMIFTSVRHFRH